MHDGDDHELSKDEMAEAEAIAAGERLKQDNPQLWAQLMSAMRSPSTSRVRRPPRPKREQQ